MTLRMRSRVSDGERRVVDDHRQMEHALERVIARTDFRDEPRHIRQASRRPP